MVLSNCVLFDKEKTAKETGVVDVLNKAEYNIISKTT